MKIEKIITLANAKVRIDFLAMERSLRACGCTLPLWVIPYNEQRFQLPEGAIWWESPEVFAWLEIWKAKAMMRKYACMLTDHYQFIDTDVVFLKNPEEFLKPFDGFVTSCCHWHNPGEAVSEQTRKIFARNSTTWPRLVFNAGQFACDRPLFHSFEALKLTAENPQNVYTCLQFPYTDQPGFNILRHCAGVKITQLTLPPYNIESSWASDYTDADFRTYWKPSARMPYLLHWAGRKADGSLPIDEYFFKWLTSSEKSEYMERLKKAKKPCVHRWINKVRCAWKAFERAS